MYLNFVLERTEHTYITVIVSGRSMFDEFVYQTYTDQNAKVVHGLPFGQVVWSTDNLVPALPSPVPPPLP